METAATYCKAQMHLMYSVWCSNSEAALPPAREAPSYIFTTLQDPRQVKEWLIRTVKDLVQRD